MFIAHVLGPTLPFLPVPRRPRTFSLVPVMLGVLVITFTRTWLRHTEPWLDGAQASGIVRCPIPASVVSGILGTA